MGLLYFDLVQHALLAGLTERILVFPHIFLRHAVDVRVGAVLRDLAHPAAHLDVAVRIVRIDDRKRDPRVAIAVQDPDNPYRYVEIRGRVREITQDGADAHIDAMAKKYFGKDKYPFRQPGEQRVLYKIAIEKAHAVG